MSGRAGATVCAVVLAAGAARRFGRQKLLARLGGGTLIRRTAERVLQSDVGEVVVVVGHEAAAVRSALAGLPLRFVANRRYRSGLASSLRCGIRALPADAAAALVALGDQPGIRPDVIARLLAEYRTGSAPIVAPSYRGFRGNPVVFDRSIFPELLQLRGDEGARRLLAAEPRRVTLVGFDASPPDDIDTDEDLGSLDHDRGAP